MQMKRIAVSVMLVVAVAACTDSPTTPVPVGAPPGKLASNVGIESFTTFDNPDAGYLAATTKIDFSGTPDGDFVSFITDGSRTVTFNTVMQKSISPGAVDWSTPPYEEEEVPPYLFSYGENSKTLTLSGPNGKKKKIQAFGFELQPNALDRPSGFTASFYDGATLIGSVTRNIVSPSGARLFALCTDTGQITSVVIAWDEIGDDPHGFLVAQVRYDRDRCAPKPPKPPKP